jgi:hypothetical protein
MEFLFPIVAILATVVRVVLRKRETTVTLMRDGTLCRSCVNAHMVKGFNGQELISCTFGGTLRPMKFEVRECTGFSSRLVTITPVRIEGFVREEGKVYAETRIS